MYMTNEMRDAYEKYFMDPDELARKLDRKLIPCNVKYDESAKTTETPYYATTRYEGLEKHNSVMYNIEVHSDSDFNPTNNSNNIVFNRKKINHAASEVKERHKPHPFFNKRKGFVCFYCKVPGHLPNDCRKLKRDYNEGFPTQPQYQSRPNKSNQGNFPRSNQQRSSTKPPFNPSSSRPP